MGIRGEDGQGALAAQFFEQAAENGQDALAGGGGVGRRNRTEGGHHFR